jgi:hypothetical protein
MVFLVYATSFKILPVSVMVFSRQLCLILVIVMPPVVCQASTEEDLRRSILSLGQIRTQVAQELELLSNRQARYESELFISFLTQRIDSSCRDLYIIGGEELLAGMPCNPDEMPNHGVVIDATTNQEKLSTLDRELVDSLSAFDDMLLKEEEKVTARQPSRREESSDGQADGAGQGSGNPGDAGEGDQGKRGGSQAGATGNEQDGAGGAATSGDQQGEGQSGAGDLSGNTGGGDGEGDEKAKDGSDHLEEADDDIIARQLREAAEKETDPELKKKLWEEYHRYKRDNQ